MITIKIEDMYRIEPGTKCLIDGKLYLYTGSEGMDIVEFADVKTGFVYYNDDPKFADIKEIKIDTTPNVDLLFKFKLKEILRLYNDGWTVDDENFSLKHKLEELATLAEILKIVKAVDV